MASGGILPLGYYKDPEKTAATYRVIDGKRWAVAGDWFNTCLDNHETKSVVEKDAQDGATAGVQGTPTTFINGKAVVGAVPYANIKAAIDAELQ